MLTQRHSPLLRGPAVAMVPCVAFGATANPFSRPFIPAVPPPAGWSLGSRPCPTRLVSLPGSEEAVNPAPWPRPFVPGVGPTFPFWEHRWREGSLCQVVSSCPWSGGSPGSSSVLSSAPLSTLSPVSSLHSFPAHPQLQPASVLFLERAGLLLPQGLCSSYLFSCLECSSPMLIRMSPSP